MIRVVNIGQGGERLVDLPERDVAHENPARSSTLGMPSSGAIPVRLGAHPRGICTGSRTTALSGMSGGTDSVTLGYSGVFQGGDGPHEPMQWVAFLYSLRVDTPDGRRHRVLHAADHRHTDLPSMTPPSPGGQRSTSGRRRSATPHPSSPGPVPDVEAEQDVVAGQVHRSVDEPDPLGHTADRERAHRFHPGADDGR